MTTLKEYIKFITENSPWSTKYTNGMDHLQNEKEYQVDKNKILRRLNIENKDRWRNLFGCTCKQDAIDQNKHGICTYKYTVTKSGWLSYDLYEIYVISSEILDDTPSLSFDDLYEQSLAMEIYVMEGISRFVPTSVITDNAPFELIHMKNDLLVSL